MRTRLAALAALVLSVAALPAAATNGYFAHGYGTPYVAMGGAGVALPLNTVAPATNPAADSFLTGYDLSVGLFNPNREYTVTGNPSGYPGTFGLAPGTVTSSNSLFYMPNIGANWKTGEKTTVGLVVYGNGGMNTTYDSPTFYAGRTGVDLSQLFMAPTVTYRVAEGHAFGVSPIVAYQRFQAEGLQNFAALSSDPSCLTNNGYAQSFGWGARIGYLGKITDWLSVGAAYQTRISMGKMDEYCGLFAEDGAFDVPQNWTAGVAVVPLPGLTVALDVQEIYYSQVNSVGNAMIPNLMIAPLGATNGAGFGWHDVTAYKAGLQYEAGAGWVLRAGYSYAAQPVPSSEVLFNILAPGIVEHHVTAGVSKEVGQRTRAHLSVMHALSNSVTGANVLEAPGQQRIELKMNEWLFDMGLSFGF